MPQRFTWGFLSLLLVGVAMAAAPSIATFPDPRIDEPERHASKRETAVLAGGCFWGVEAVYDHVKGVVSTVSGYSGGDRKTAHTSMVESGGTGHAESVKLTYDPSKISYGQILKIFFSVVHNPTERNRQGPDVGPQYRSVIFFADEKQKSVAEAYIHQLDQANVYGARIVTEVVPLRGFYAAEEVHQHYSERNPQDPYVVANDLPKLTALKRDFPGLYK